MCKFRTNDGGCIKTNRQCVENGCVQWEQASEARYQAYIDELHKQIEELTAQLNSWIETATELEDKLDKYEIAMVNAFVKWSEAE